MFIYFTSLEYLEKQTKLEEEEVRTEKAGKQFHLRTTGATKKKSRFIMSVSLWYQFDQPFGSKNMICEIFTSYRNVDKCNK